MNDYAARLRATADYIDRHDVPRLLSVTVSGLTDVVDFHGSPLNCNRVAVFLRWADTLDGDVALVVVPREKDSRFHLYARGTLPGTDLAAEFVVIVDGDDYPALADEIGSGEDEIPVIRGQLANIAAGRGELTPELLAEAEHWAANPLPRDPGATS
ncbi:hypothetical protein VA596_41420 [Amycolatopsis sp., V23-08]|uniref:Uncharacterized protein n=1 Tax=Amycolatopsis heterodermiae TaxID=3110235 RepID=A0ABU5RID6_9PSEU|nr:hypothetical protein [Amycolatopsis sp., V23-08]MEA5366047.1 hypothetical protein [Amycolatopsis sp., V23-08]